MSEYKPLQFGLFCNIGQSINKDLGDAGRRYVLDQRKRYIKTIIKNNPGLRGIRPDQSLDTNDDCFYIFADMDDNGCYGFTDCHSITALVYETIPYMELVDELMKKNRIIKETFVSTKPAKSITIKSSIKVFLK